MILRFKSILELNQHFNTQKKCKAYLAKIRWGNEPCCMHCGGVGAYPLKDGRYKCKEKECGKKFSVTSGTIFENTKVPLPKWFMAAYLLTAHKKGISSLQLSRDINVTQKTAWFMLHRLREIFTYDPPEMIEGEVEMDETFVGGKFANMNKTKRLRLRETMPISGYVHMTPIFGMLERKSKLIMAFPIEQPSQKVLHPIIHKYVSKQSTLITDYFGGYKGLNEHYKAHIRVNHSDNEYVRDGQHTNTLEGFWSHLKRGIIGIYHYTSPKHLHRYCNEFAYRYNSREVPDDIRFSSTLFFGDGKRLKYKDLISRQKY